jgi:hypothetical protein
MLEKSSSTKSVGIEGGNLEYAQLFDWWIATISWSIAFLIVVSIYLYKTRARRVRARGSLWWVRDFAFVWFLLALLIFYIGTVSRGSYSLFAVGNVVFEALLVLYVIYEFRATPK